MREIPKELRLDERNLWYLDDRDIHKKLITFEHERYNFIPRSKFYTIDEIDDYLIKIDDQVVLFHDERTKYMLAQFGNIRTKIKNVDLPIGYYQERGRTKGQVIPYYQNGVSIRNFLRFYSKKLETLYCHDDNKIRNVLKLYMDILDLIWEMYDNNLIYMDVHEGNFIIYQNGIKVIDFEPSLIHFKPTDRYYSMICDKFCHLINGISYSLGIDMVLIFPSSSFYKTKESIKTLYKKI